MNKKTLYLNNNDFITNKGKITLKPNIWKLYHFATKVYVFDLKANKYLTIKNKIGKRDIVVNNWEKFFAAHRIG